MLHSGTIRLSFIILMRNFQLVRDYLMKANTMLE
jgi:hypothetical protein